MAYSFDPKDDVEAQWQKWSDSGIEFTDVDFGKLREQTINELTYVSAMDVREYTLFQKWCEIQEKYPTITVNDLWEGEKKVHFLRWDKNQCDKTLLKEFIKVANDAHELVGHNSDMFDLPWIRTRCLFHNIDMFPTYTTIDTYKISKNV